MARRTINRLLSAAFVWLLAAQHAPAVNAQTILHYDLEQLEQAIEAGDLGKIRAVAAEQHGVTVYRKRFGQGELGDPIDIRSAGKSITALAVGAAIADGAIPGTDLAVWPYLGRPRGEPFDSITVQDLLDMSSALDCNDWNRQSPGQEERMYREHVWRDFALALPAREYARKANGMGPFSYCTAGVFLLGQVVQQATGERFDRYVERRLFSPLGIAGAEWRRSRSGEIQSGGQLTIGDEALLKIGRLILARGQWDGKQIVPAEWVDTLFRPRHELSEFVRYGNLWWATPLRSQNGYVGALMMKGNGGNILAIVPDYDAVLLVQAQNYNRDNAERNAFVVLTALLESLPSPQ